ncbi:hypothetical protein PLESTB_001401200 [Pleodorina starrii]|uniref:Uncharacterized protein n=1 Tax=Pleodorina starrii TaxID=330485 RepID=A0A9W6BVF6_9CHLO|nr:hypothetical protein PLESTM_000531600 [Pleodorina starrii]GLC58788.1 hypothetical protein PLESTB_001401200 [Pleodorina starrii]GLC68721.1 hypothetical protein PLESTF_000728100 [Pleodorina starrii]
MLHRAVGARTYVPAWLPSMRLPSYLPVRPAGTDKQQHTVPPLSQTPIHLHLEPETLAVSHNDCPLASCWPAVFLPALPACPPRVQLSYKPSDPVALKAAEPRRATAQLVSGLTRGSPTRGAAPPLRVHSGIRVSPGGLARPWLAQPQRYSALAASIDMTAAVAATAAAVATTAIRSTDGSTAAPTPAQRANTQLLAKLAACAEASVSRLTFPSAGSSVSSRRVVTPSRPASPPPSRFAAPTTTTTTIAAAPTIAAIPAPATTPAARVTTSACSSTVSTFTAASEREAATATTISFAHSASTASSSAAASSFTRTASDTASSYDSDEDCEREKEEQGEDDLPLLGASFIGNRGVFVAAGEGSAAPLRWSGMGADRAAEEDGDNNAAA